MRLWPGAATQTTAVTVTQGQVRDAITGLPIPTARLDSVSVLVPSDIKGVLSPFSDRDGHHGDRAPLRAQADPAMVRIPASP